MNGAEAGMDCLPAADGIGVAALCLQLIRRSAVAQDLPASTLAHVQAAWPGLPVARLSDVQASMTCSAAQASGAMQVDRQPHQQELSPPGSHSHDLVPTLGQLNWQAACSSRGGLQTQHRRCYRA